jgi:hypothetical protein
MRSLQQALARTQLSLFFQPKLSHPHEKSCGSLFAHKATCVAGTEPQIFFDKVW